MSTGEWPFNNELSINSNIFMYLCSRDEKFNSDGHIAVVLGNLVLRQARLCIDREGAILAEYQRIK